MKYDVVVVGAGPAGSTAARYAARRGLRVLLLEKRRVIGVPVQCGEYVASDEEIQRIFPKVEELGDLMSAAHEVKQIETYVIRIHSPKGRTYDVPFHGYTVSRDRMDQRIASQAVREGAEILLQTCVVDIRDQTVVTDRGIFEGRVIIGADGPRSRVAKSVGLPWPVSAPAMNVNVEGDFDNVTHMFFGNLAPGGYAWIIPKGNVANIGLGTWQHFRGNLNNLFLSFARTNGFEVGKPSGGYVPVLGPVPQTIRGNVMLVGDAAGQVMATNGGGINVAMICGRLAGEIAADHILKRRPLDLYEPLWRKAVGEPLDVGVRIKRFADHFFGHDGLLELAMLLLGRRRMARAIRCQPLFRLN